MLQRFNTVILKMFIHIESMIERITPNGLADDSAVGRLRCSLEKISRRQSWSCLRVHLRGKTYIQATTVIAYTSLMNSLKLLLLHSSFTRRFLILLGLILTCIRSCQSFMISTRKMRTTTIVAGYPRPLHDVFTVEKASEQLLEELDVKSWPRWTTEGTEKYKTKVKSPLKVYDCNELSYVQSGSMEIIPADPSKDPVIVKPGDFVTFPDGFACYWYVIEPVVKLWYIY